MFVVTGVTGKVGGQVARKLLARGEAVRAVVRDRAKGQYWSSLGCEVAIASIDDAEALTRAFEGTDGVFLMTPPNYDPEPGFPDTQRNASAIRKAIQDATPSKVVFLSTVGAQVKEPNLLNNSGITEAMLRTVSTPTALLRAAWFMENAAWDVEAAKAGLIQSFLQPLEHKIPMVAIDDIAAAAVGLLLDKWEGTRIVELEGPERYSSDDVCEALANALSLSAVTNQAVPRASWEELFRSQGMRNPLPRIQMLDGFNEGWIDFEFGVSRSTKGQTSLQTAMLSLAESKNG
jgi:uncharacterized protein YbjT (DUF2867 family)